MNTWRDASLAFTAAARYRIRAARRGVTRATGTSQLAADEGPMRRYAQDAAPGRTNGQGGRRHPVGRFPDSELVGAAR
ncbi:hypothetical protein [Streptomyces sp. NPDC094466]|uniref:hypothetical protein n=1 Tax=Streptomyces sp. NPDC094466 TaxID=3366065 RepID=UPI003810705F